VIRPNFFLIGAPKCGTSSLFAWLTAHPYISGSRDKEPFFLMDRDHLLIKRPNIHDDGLAAYASCFPNDAPNARVRVEATTHYLYQQGAVDIVGNWSDARVAVVLRAPADRVFSSFSYTQNNLARLDPELSFSAYLELVRRGEPLFPRWCNHRGSAYVLERDIDYSHYKKYLDRWIGRLGRERIDIVLFDDLQQRPAEVVRLLLQRLGLESSDLPERQFDPRNQTVSVRHARLHAIARRLDRSFRLPGNVRLLLKRAYAKIHKVGTVQKSDADMLALAELRTSFMEEVCQLETLTGSDLTGWKTADRG